MVKLKNVYPGEILLEEWLKPMGVSQYRLAVEIGVSPRRITEIVHGKHTITADTAHGLRASSAPRRSSSSTCNRITTWKKRRLKPARRCKKSFRRLNGLRLNLCLV